MGSSTSTEAPVGDKADTQRRSAPITSSSDHVGGIGGSVGCAVGASGLAFASAGLPGNGGAPGRTGASRDKVLAGGDTPSAGAAPGERSAGRVTGWASSRGDVR